MATSAEVGGSLSRSRGLASRRGRDSLAAVVRPPSGMWQWRPRGLAVSVAGATEPGSSPAAGLTTGRPPRCSRRAPRPPDDEPSRPDQSAFVISSESANGDFSTAIGRNW